MRLRLHIVCFVLWLWLPFIAIGQTGAKNIINLDNSKNNIIKVIQGDVIKVYNLNSRKDIDECIAYLNTMPQIKRTLDEIRKDVKKGNKTATETSKDVKTLNDKADITNKLLEQLLFKSLSDGVLDPFKIQDAYDKLKEENKKLKVEIETLRKPTNNTELSQILQKAQGYLDIFDNENYQKTLEDFKQINKHEVAKVSYLQSQNNFNIGNYSKSLEQIKEAIEYKRDAWEYYNHQATILIELADYDSALVSFRLSEDLIDKAPNDSLAHATLFNNIGIVLDEKGDYDNALNYYEKALSIEVKILGKESPSLSIIYNNIGSSYKGKGDYKKALNYYEKELSIDEKVLGKDHPTTATGYNNIGILYDLMNDFKKGKIYLEKALSIREKVLGKEHPYTAITYNNIGYHYFEDSNFISALRYYEKALSVFAKVVGKKHPYTATTYNNLGLLYLHKKEYEKSLFYFDEALSIREKVFGKWHPETGKSYNNIGLLYKRSGNYDSSLTYYRIALTINENLLGKEHINTALNYNNLGILHYIIGNYDSALIYMEKALIVREEVLGKEHPITIGTYGSIGQIYLMQGEEEKAFDFLSKSNLSRKTYYEQATLMNQNGEQAFKIEKFRAALNCYNYAHELLQKSDKPVNDELYMILYNNMAKAHCYLGNKKEALPLFEKAIKLGQTNGMDMKKIESNYEGCKKK